LNEGKDFRLEEFRKEELKRGLLLPPISLHCKITLGAAHCGESTSINKEGTFYRHLHQCLNIWHYIYVRDIGKYPKH
jgi:hypothetical protein